MIEYNYYCDESCYLENDHKKFMVMGTIKCEKNYRKEFSKSIRELKKQYNINEFQELKWVKVCKKTLPLYKKIVDFFFDNSHLSFRAVIVDKDNLNHQKFNQTHDDFYYKVYYQLLCIAIMPNDKNYIYLDIKDTKSSRKIKRLTNCLKNGIYDFNMQHINRMQSINSKESELLQLTDIFIGAIGYINRQEDKKSNYSKSKYELANYIAYKSGYNLKRSTLLSEDKFNLFFMRLEE